MLVQYCKVLNETETIAYTTFGFFTPGFSDTWNPGEGDNSGMAEEDGEFQSGSIAAEVGSQGGADGGEGKRGFLLPLSIICHGDLERFTTLKENLNHPHRWINCNGLTITSFINVSGPSSHTVLTPAVSGPGNLAFCDKCNRTFSSRSHLVRHSSYSKCSGTEPKFMCLFCRKLFHRNDNLNMHKLKAHGIKH